MASSVSADPSPAPCVPGVDRGVPCGAQALILLAKVNALQASRYNVSMNDIATQAPSVLRHRLIRNFEAEADEVSQDALVADVVQRTEQADLLSGAA